MATEDENSRGVGISLGEHVELQNSFAGGEAPIFLGRFGGMHPRKIFDSYGVIIVHSDAI